MGAGSLFAAMGAAQGFLFGLLSFVYVVVSAYVYISLIQQIRSRASSHGDASGTGRTFGLPEAILAGILILFLLLNIGAAMARPAIEFNRRNLVENFLLIAFVVLFVVSFLQFRGIDVAALGGFTRMSFVRALSTGVILLFFAYPLIVLCDTITQWFFGGGSTKQSIVEFFSGSRTIEQRALIIFFAVTIAPVVEEFLFRFFIYGVFRRYFGRLLGIVLSALLFAAAHTHFPSLVPLFVLGSCFAIAYEWSGSILVSMTMHSLFNSLTLTVLAFPQVFAP